MKLELLRYQDTDADRFETRCKGKGMLNHEMGLGKSAIALTNRKRYGPFKRPIVVVCYAILKWNWQDECRKWGFDKSVILSTRTPPDTLPSKQAKRSATVYIVNYDILPDWLDWIKALEPGMIIIDESHAIKSRTTKRYKAVKKLVKRVPKIATLSGTPVINTPADIWTTLNILRPKLFPSFMTFASRYCKVQRTRWGLKFSGGKNLDELNRLLIGEGIMIRRLKKDVLKQLPPKIRNVIHIDLPPAMRREYDMAEKNYVRWLHGVAPHMAANARRMAAMQKRNGLKRLIGVLKLRSLMDWINLFLESSNKKLIVFGIHYKVLVPLHDKYQKISVLVNGKTPEKDRKGLVKKFMKNPKCRIFFGNIQAAGTGLNLTAAEAILKSEIGWTSVEHDQAESRANRIGQTEILNVYYMLVRNSIENDIVALIHRKQKEADLILDGEEREESLKIITEYVDKAILKRVKGRKK